MKSRKVKLAGWGKATAKHEVRFGDQVRFRMQKGEDLLDLADRAIAAAFESAGMEIEDIDCIVCGMATPLQVIPCNAALIHERWAKRSDIPAMDINTTCTSFIAALDVVSCLIEIGRYRNVLIVSGDTASAALNPSQQESFGLFSDAAAAFIVTPAEENEASEVVYSAQKTWSEGVHDTEIRGGGALMPAFEMDERNRDDYYFDMKGSRILKLSVKKLPGFVEQCMAESAVAKKDIRLVVPHQASRALGVIMPRLGFSKESYVDYVQEYGNMVSASVPFTLCRIIEEGRVKRGDMVLLIGTAAGLTANFLLLRL